MRPPLGITTKSDFVFTQPGPDSDMAPHRDGYNVVARIASLLALS